MELESGLLPAPAGSAALSVSWRARSRHEQIRDHHRAQRRGSSRRYKSRICGDRFLYSEMVRKHIANEHNETMPPSMYEYFHGAIWQRKKLS